MNNNPVVSFMGYLMSAYFLFQMLAAGMFLDEMQMFSRLFMGSMDGARSVGQEMEKDIVCTRDGCE
jgi:hypothetical protein